MNKWSAFLSKIEPEDVVHALVQLGMLLVTTGVIHSSPQAQAVALGAQAILGGAFHIGQGMAASSAAPTAPLAPPAPTSPAPVAPAPVLPAPVPPAPPAAPAQ